MPSRRSLISLVTVTLVVGVGGGVAPAALAFASAGTTISRCCSTGGQQRGLGALDRNDRAHSESLVGGLDRLTNTIERASKTGKTSAAGSRTIDRNDRAHFQTANTSRGVVEHRSGI
jgi:hypothetical protein